MIINEDRRLCKNSESCTRVVMENLSIREFMEEVYSLWRTKDPRYTSSQDVNRGGGWVVFSEFEEFNDIALGKKKSEAIENYIRKVTSGSAALKKLFNYERGDSSVLRDDYDITGFYVDVGRFLDNEPECFINTVKPVNELIDIHICGGMHCDVRVDEYMKSVEFLAKLVYILKAKGCNARIFYYIEGTYGAAKIKLKDFKDTLNLRSLVITQMPDFFRRYGFLLFELDPNLKDGYGQIRDGMFAKWRKDFSKNTLSIDLLRYDSLNLSESLLEKVARERDIKKVVSMVNGESHDMDDF